MTSVTALPAEIGPGLKAVQSGDPHVPYIMAGAGYPGLLLIT